MNSEMPRVPSGASGRRASTMWTMFSVRSCSPAEMKILVPVMPVAAVGLRHGPRLRTWPRSVPHCGSVRHMVPVHSPATSGGRYCVFCCLGAVRMMVFMQRRG